MSADEDLRRLFESGNESALCQAANKCLDPDAKKAIVPTWVLQALIQRQVEYMTRLAPGTGKGRNATWFAQHRMDRKRLEQELAEAERELDAARGRGTLQRRGPEAASVANFRAEATRG